MLKSLLYIFLLCSFPLALKSQDILEKKISVEYNNTRIEDILQDLHHQLGVSFSYSANLFLPNTLLSLKIKQREARFVFYKIFDYTSTSFEQKGHYIILKKKCHTSKIHYAYKLPASRFPDTVKTKIANEEPAHNINIVYRDSVFSYVKQDTIQKTPEHLPLSNENEFNNSNNILAISAPSKTTKEVLENPTYKYRPQRFYLFHYAKGNYQQTQISLLLNKGKKINGFQVGFINIAQSVSSVQIGLFNFCKNGYKKIELWTSSTLEANGAFKTGTSKLYTIIAGGVSTDGEFEDYDWGLGYGIGKEFSLGKKTVFSIDAILYQLGNDLKRWPQWHLMQQFRFNAGYKINKSITLFAGPEINIRLSQPTNTLSTDNDKDSDDSRLKKTQPNSSQQPTLWLGLNGGIRF